MFIMKEGRMCVISVCHVVIVSFKGPSQLLLSCAFPTTEKLQEPEVYLVKHGRRLLHNHSQAPDIIL